MVANTSIPRRFGLGGFFQVKIPIRAAMTRQTPKYHFDSISTMSFDDSVTGSIEPIFYHAGIAERR